MCCFVIVTLRSLLWSLLSIVVALTELAAMLSSHWLVDYQESNYQNESRTSLQKEEVTVRSTGLFIRCVQNEPINFISSDDCLVYAHTITDIASPWWIATSIFMALAILILSVVALSSVVAFCYRNIAQKSIFSICGILQAVAGLFLIFALVMFPAGWGSERVQVECSDQSSAFNPGSCHIGWAYYAAIFGTFSAFLSAVLSNQAESSVNNDKIDDDISDGKNPVFAL